jgi:hypothetical protein
MKRIFALLFAALAAASSAFAQSVPDVGMLKQAASSLSKIDPSLAKGLEAIASRDTNAAQRAAQGGTSRGNTVQDKKDIDTLNQSADKLNATRPDLSKELRNYADQKSNLLKSDELQNMQHRGYTP